MSGSVTEPTAGRVTLARRRLREAGRWDFTDAAAAVDRRAALADGLDEWLSQVWDDASASVLGTGADATAAGLALAAVGGHARKDSGPAGDLDLILLHSAQIDRTTLSDFADRLWYPLWDNGFRLDHAVRTTRESVRVAHGDISAAIALLDLRPVVGDAALVAVTGDAVREDWRRHARARVGEVLESVEERTRRHGDLAHAQEGDLKYARGGLRDTVVLDAVTASWLADAPGRRWREGRAFLLDVRDALHAVTGRATERLTLTEQDAVAAVLGLPDPDALWLQVSASARAVRVTLDQSLHHAAQAVSRRSGLRRLHLPRIRRVEPGLGVHEGEVVTISSTGDALLPVRGAALAAREGRRVSGVTATGWARESLAHPLPDPWPDAARAAFVDLLAGGEGLPEVWETLDQAGLVSQWIPEWDAVRNRRQRNAVHRFTVDRHLVETCVQSAPLLSRVHRPDLLLTAALLHDIGKIAGASDHSQTGAPIAATVMRRLGFEPADVDVVTTLVRHHLLLIDLATRRDPEDPRTIAALVDAVADAETLTLLRCLTEADALAAGPAAWSGWRARLVDDLERRTRAHLTGQRGEPEDVLSEEEQRLIASARTGPHPQVRISSDDAGACVTVVASDRAGLFVDVAGVLAAHGVGIRSATVRTVRGVALDTYRTSTDPPAAQILETALRRLAQGDATMRDRLHRVTQRAAPPGPTQVFLIPGASQRATVVEVHAPDRPGLLFLIGQALHQTGVDLLSAHVSTVAGRAVDVMYLVEPDGDDAASRVLTPARAAEVISALGRAVGPE